MAPRITAGQGRQAIRYSRKDPVRNVPKVASKNFAKAPAGVHTGPGFLGSEANEVRRGRCTTGAAELTGLSS